MQKLKPTNNPFSTKVAFSLVFASLFSAFFAGALVLGIGLNSSTSSQKFYTFLSFIIGQGFMLLPLIWYLITKKRSLLATLRLNLVSTDILKSTILLSLGIIILSDELDRIIQIIVPAPDYILDLNELLQPDSFLGFVLLFIAVAIIAPLGEELLFRGFLQKILEKQWKDVTRAVLITALIFAVIHMNPYWFAQIYILGIILGFLSWKTNSVIPPLILHGMNNTTALLFAIFNIQDNNIYLWNNHVSPIFIIIAILLLGIGFIGINKMGNKSL